jgi:hypothetical protein
MQIRLRILKSLSCFYKAKWHGCSGVWIGKWEICLCGFNWSFLTCGLGVGYFTMRWAAVKVTSSKMPKHEKACANNQHILILFAFDIFGILALEAVNLLKKV